MTLLQCELIGQILGSAKYIKIATQIEQIGCAADEIVRLANSLYDSLERSGRAQKNTKEEKYDFEQFTSSFRLNGDE